MVFDEPWTIVHRARVCACVCGCWFGYVRECIRVREHERMRARGYANVCLFEFVD